MKKPSNSFKTSKNKPQISGFIESAEDTNLSPKSSDLGLSYSYGKLELRSGRGIELHSYGRFQVADCAIKYRKDSCALGCVAQVERGCAGDAMLGQGRIEGCLRMGRCKELRRT